MMISVQTGKVQFEHVELADQMETPFQETAYWAFLDDGRLPACFDSLVSYLTQLGFDKSKHFMRENDLKVLRAVNQYYGWVKK